MAVNFGPTSAILLAVLSCAHADKVITRSCGTRGLGFRVRHYPTDTEATSLIADNCQLTEIDTDDFNGLPYLIAIDLEHNDITHIHPAAFRSVPRLMLLDLNRNKLRDLPVFEESCPNLKTIDLRENQLSILNNSKALSACTELEKIYLSKNKIEYLHPDLFRDLTELKILHLNNNKIVVIHDLLLLNNNKLEWFEVQNNKLTYLPNNLISNNLKQINFKGNPWHCECLLELLANVKKAGVKYDYWMYNGLRPKCVYTGVRACSRAPSGLPLLSAAAAERR